MQVTMKHYTSTRYTQEQFDSLSHRIVLVSTAPVEFFYKGEKLSIDHIGGCVIERRYGFDLVFTDVLEFPEVPEGHEVTIQMISTHGDPDSVRYIGSFNVEIAPPTLQSRFHEYFTNYVLPEPLSSTLGDVAEDVAELAQLAGHSKWNFGKREDEYQIQLDLHMAAFGTDLTDVHREFLRGVAMAARYPEPTRHLNGCLSYGRTGECQ